MVWIPSGTFSMGSNHTPNEQPVHKRNIAGFWLDETEVTHAQFRAFVEATGYVTTAEQRPTAASIGGISAEEFAALDTAGKITPGANNFQSPTSDVDLSDELQWWIWQPYASWRQPEGPQSRTIDRDNLPVVCVSWDDAQAYARWAGKRLPTEAEWEYAARAGTAHQAYSWGTEMTPAGRWMMNIWQGSFPRQDSATDGFHGLAPVRSYPANPWGLYEMAGNVWEWTADVFSPTAYQHPDRTPSPATGQPLERVIRGGSWLCNDCYCSGYRVSARQKTTPDSASHHMGFRCARSAATP
jgi:formylglycine-generating enzyme